ncbi:MAG TPA: hypothetical protein VFS16_20160 [Acidimicrobiia bacterium]|nr:hypothetical protein [Acidimicrobiia bacterium]
MFKRLATALLVGPLLVGLIPTAASAAPAERTVRSFDHRTESHYECMYRCDERRRGGRYDRRYDRRGRYDRYDRCRYDRCRGRRVYHDGRCYYHDGDRWRRCRYRY